MPKSIDHFLNEKSVFDILVGVFIYGKVFNTLGQVVPVLMSAQDEQDAKVKILMNENLSDAFKKKFFKKVSMLYHLCLTIGLGRDQIVWPQHFETDESLASSEEADDDIDGTLTEKKLESR